MVSDPVRECLSPEGELRAARAHTCFQANWQDQGARASDTRWAPLERPWEREDPSLPHSLHPPCLAHSLWGLVSCSCRQHPAPGPAWQALSLGGLAS